MSDLVKITVKKSTFDRVSLPTGNITRKKEFIQIQQGNHPPFKLIEDEREHYEAKIDAYLSYFAQGDPTGEIKDSTMCEAKYEIAFYQERKRNIETEAKIIKQNNAREWNDIYQNLIQQLPSMYELEQEQLFNITIPDIQKMEADREKDFQDQVKQKHRELEQQKKQLIAEENQQIDGFKEEIIVKCDEKIAYYTAIFEEGCKFYQNPTDKVNGKQYHFESL